MAAASKEVHLQEVLKAISPAALAVVPPAAPVLVKELLEVPAVILQGVVPAAVVGLDKITIIQIRVQQNVPLYQYLYLYPLVGHIMAVMVVDQ
ncbi:hypothetical protein Clopa_0210 [Clostridium pasteurianum BC1]|uniref:Uncharacterized protein n=1 Tax=Clostridium pasteurianum BC1 TaxID=86416 RepID=R4JWU1_CLOPA|nr:hypothetical protein Clopa_0210 [Clostridium pasteurianum BC1]